MQVVEHSCSNLHDLNILNWHARRAEVDSCLLYTSDAADE